MNDRLISLGIVGVAFGLGMVAGHLWTKRRLEMAYFGKLDAEMEAARKYYLKLNKQEDYSDPSKLVEDKDDFVYAPASLSDIGPENFHMFDGSPLPDIEDPPLTEVNEFDYKKEIPKRDPKIAYVISSDEFFENEKDYDQRTLIYFSKDDVVVEERDTPIDDVLAVLGPTALDQFGNGSKDPNIVYVRNDWMAMDFEVCYDPDSFEETVLGNLKHGELHKVRKFRIDDD